MYSSTDLSRVLLRMTVTCSLVSGERRRELSRASFGAGVATGTPTAGECGGVLTGVPEEFMIAS